MEVNFSKSPKCLGLTARLEDGSSCPDARDVLARFQFFRQKDSGEEYQEFKMCTEYQEVDKEQVTDCNREEALKEGERKWSVRDLLDMPWRDVLHAKEAYFVEGALKLKVAVFLKHRH